MIIYKTTNLVNGKIYVGKDKFNNPNYLGSGKVLKQAIKKYGVESFSKEILEVCENESVWLQREQFWIKELNSIEFGYNIAVGGAGGDTISNNPNKQVIAQKHSEWMKTNNPKKGKTRTTDEINKWKKSYEGKWKGKNNPNYGRRHSEETKNKIRERALGREVSEETRKKISIANKGKAGRVVPTEERIAHSEWMKENNPFRGKTHTDEVKRMLSEVNSKPKADSHRNTISLNSPNNKKCMINNITYRSVAEASRVLGISESTLRGRIKNEKNTNYNWI